MVILDDNTTISTVFLPKTKENSEITGNLYLRLHSDITGEDYQFQDLGAIEIGGYIRFNKNFTALADGEYEYTLMAGQEIISQGLWIIGSRIPNNTKYNSEITYKQYGK